MNNIDKLAKALVDSAEIKEKKKTSPYYTSAKVVKVEGDTAWVSIEGGVEQTPARMVVNARAGEEVRVHVAGGNAYVTGNATAPPTDDTTALKAESAASRASRAANIADMKAEAASKAADSATKDAAIAHEAADSAIADAGRAREAAESAQADADIAKASARDANEYATRALSGLSTVQSVAETLTWITQHGTMTLTTDTAIDPSHVYFVQDNDGDYVVGNVHYSLVIEPDVADISTYYELTIDESLNNYVGTHLAVTSEGLWLLPDAGGNKVLIATGQGSTYTSAGTYIIGKDNGSDVTLATFLANGAQIGKTAEYNVYVDNSGINMRDGTATRFQIYSAPKGSGTSSHIKTNGTNCNAGYEFYVGDSGATWTEMHVGGNNNNPPSAHVQATRESGLSDVELEANGNGKSSLINLHATSSSSYITLESNGYVYFNTANLYTDSTNFRIGLNTNAVSGVDHDLYAAITALGWENDVIV